jgi:hypothetical protein
MDLKLLYKEETSQCAEESVYGFLYATDSYVEWLEQKIKDYEEEYLT